MLLLLLFAMLTDHDVTFSLLCPVHVGRRRRPKLAAAAAAGVGGELLIPVRIRRRSQSEKVAVALFWIAVAILYLSGVVLAINNAATVEKVQILPEWWSSNRTLLEKISTYCILGAVAVLVRELTHVYDQQQLLCP